MAICQKVSSKKEKDKYKKVLTDIRKVLHDFNNTLCAASLAIETLELNPNKRQAVTKLEISSIQILNLSEKFMALVRLISDASNSSQEFFSRKSLISFPFLKKLIYELVSLYLEDTFITYEIYIKEIEERKFCLKIAIVDFLRLLSNVIINAKEAIQEKNIKNDSEGKIMITVNVIDKNGKFYLNLSCQDNGNGISEDILPRIFESNFTTKEKGSGLGLSICREIVHKYNGKIEIESKRGCGTIVSIFLPIDTGSPSRRS